MITYPMVRLLQVVATNGSNVWNGERAGVTGYFSSGTR